jgi:Na+-transporting methylmalonyl-CoA/oxaloacetate decarboxylase gamma subunit
VEFLIVLAILVVVVFVITAPLRRSPSSREGSEPTAEPAVRVRDSELAELEAAREAKYREIRDAELDHGTGKLSDADFDALNSALRAEALTILDAIERLRPAGAPEDDDGETERDDHAGAQAIE